jgi:hypothetical protein
MLSTPSVCPEVKYGRNVMVQFLTLSNLSPRILVPILSTLSPLAFKPLASYFQTSLLLLSNLSPRILVPILGTSLPSLNPVRARFLDPSVLGFGLS